MVRVPVCIISGSPIVDFMLLAMHRPKGAALKQAEMGRGTGSLWEPCTVTVENGQVVARMYVPEQFKDWSDERKIQAFIAGFNGGK